MDTKFHFFLLWNIHTLLESLPISSSGHVYIINQTLGHLAKRAPIVVTSTVDHLMHSTTFVAVTAFLLINFYIEQPSLNEILAILPCMLIANAITGFCYLLYKKSKRPPLPVYIGFFITGCTLLSLYLLPLAYTTPHAPFSYAHYAWKLTPSYFDALIIGIAQSIAVLPGISRLAITVVAALWLGIAPNMAFIFSLILEWFLALVAITKALYDRQKEPLALFSAPLSWYITLTITTAFSFVLLSLSYTATIYNLLPAFGWYMIALSLTTFIFFKKRLQN